jgi:hypothetical protein
MSPIHLAYCLLFATACATATVTPAEPRPCPPAEQFRERIGERTRVDGDWEGPLPTAPSPDIRPAADLSTKALRSIYAAVRDGVACRLRRDPNYFDSAVLGVPVDTAASPVSVHPAWVADTMTWTGRLPLCRKTATGRCVVPKEGVAYRVGRVWVHASADTVYVGVLTFLVGPSPIVGGSAFDLYALVSANGRWGVVRVYRGLVS